jgi:hypothetical protein
MAIRAEVALLLFEDGAVRQGNFCGLAQGKIAGLVGSVAGEAAYFGRIGNEFFRINLAFPGEFNETLAGVALLAVVAVGVGSIADRSMAGSQVLASNAADRIFRVRAMAVDAPLGEGDGLRFGNRREEKEGGQERQKSTKPFLGGHFLFLLE